ncbi:MAG TPA: hypothetical protein VKK81_28955 [Candidatus Binatia bacterium]|nr:hypothetical protein [Candidatus Binatia bacterium]
MFSLGEVALAQDHLAQSIALHDPQKDNPSVSGHTGDSKVISLCFAASAQWLLGYPDQALQRNREALILARELSQPYNLALALNWAAGFHCLRREGQAAQERAEATITLATEQGFPLWLGLGTAFRGWALAEQGQEEEGIAQMRQSLAGFGAIEAELAPTWFLALLAEACGKVGQIEEGLTLLAEALDLVDKTGGRWCEAELYWLKGELCYSGL